MKIYIDHNQEFICQISENDLGKYVAFVLGRIPIICVKIACQMDLMPLKEWVLSDAA